MNLDPTKDRIPVRVQRRRTKGWKMPAYTVYVGRPSKFGNPFTFGDFIASLTLLHEVRPIQNSELTDMEIHTFMVDSYRTYLLSKPDLVSLVKKELAGKNLACWCSKDKPCHVDVLLEVANS